MYILIGCNDNKNKVEKAVLGNIVNYNCIFTNDQKYQRFVIPVIAKRKYNNIQIVQLFGENVDSIEWTCISGFNNNTDVIEGLYIYPVIMQTQNVSKPVDIKSVLIQADEEEFTINFEKFKINIDTSEYLKLVNQSTEFSSPNNTELSTGEGDMYLTIKTNSPFVIDRIYFNDYINISNIEINGTQNKNNDILIEKNKLVNIDLKLDLIDKRNRNRLLYFNLIMEYHTLNDSTIKKCIYPICTNLPDDDVLKDMFKSFIIEMSEMNE